MRLSRPNGLGGLGLRSCSGDTDKPAAKRQKRADVLGSLGLDLKPTGGSSLAGRGSPSSSKSLANAVSGLSGSDSDKEALRQWLSGEEPKPQKESLPDTAQSEKATQMTAEESSECPTPSGKLDDAWRQAFHNATDRWDVDEQSLQGFYFDSEQGLYFEWDQKQGILYQYFFEAGTGSEARTVHASEGGLPERAPVWSADCPETHAEVWDCLPLPPTDPAAMAREEEQAATESTPELSSASTTTAESQASDNKPEPLTASCLPPPPVTKKRPPVPAMAAMSTVAASAQGNAGPQLPDETDFDVPGPAVLGCALPASSSGSTYSRELEDEDDQIDDGSRPPILDDDEDIADLAAEDCALPQAPAERAQPSATDLDLDIFGGLESG